MFTKNGFELLSQKQKDKTLNSYQKNNEYYLEIFNKLEKIKINYISNDINLFIKILNKIKENDIYLITKIDKRKVKKIKLEDYTNKINEEYELYKILENEAAENDLYKKELIKKEEEIKSFIINYLEIYFISLNTMNSLNIKNKDILDLFKFQNFYLQQVILMNYPYVFSEISKFINYNTIYKSHLKDIENTTLEIIINSIIKFNINSNNKFITYMTFWIKYGIEEEITKILKDVKIKYNDNVPISYRFITKNFLDTNIDHDIKVIKSKITTKLSFEEKNELKKEITYLTKLKKESYKKYINNINNKDFSIFNIFDMKVNNDTSIKSIVEFLNKIISTKENRKIFLDYIHKEKSEILSQFSSKDTKELCYQIILCLTRNKTDVDTKKNYENAEFINEGYEDNSYNINNIIDKLKKKLDDENIDLLEKFLKEEINSFPNKNKKQLEKVLRETHLYNDLKL